MNPDSIVGKATYDPFPSLNGAEPPDGGKTTWGLVDVGAIARGERGATPPSMLTRSDGVSLIYAGKVHSLNSESEAGKTWVALLACAQEMANGSHVLYVDFEDGPEGIVGRLLDMGVTAEAAEMLFHYVRPDEPLGGDAQEEFSAVLAGYSPALTVIDGITEAMVMHGYSIKDNDDAARFMEKITRPIARSGSAVLALDHVTKDTESRGRFAIGAQHKLSGVDGAVYSMTATTPFGRGQSGASTLKVNKDRPGYVRPQSGAKDAIGTVQFIAGEDGAMEVRLDPPGRPAAGSIGEDFVADEPTLLLVTEAVERLAAKTPVTAEAVRKDVHKKATTVRACLSWLASAGYVKKRSLGEGKEILYSHVRPYTGDEDAEKQPESGAK